MEYNTNKVTGDNNTSVTGDNNKIFQKLTDQINELKDKPYPKTIFFWVSGFSLLFSLIAVCGAFVYKDTVLVEESIVLILVGALATFVVVGNYIQTQGIEREFYKKIEASKIVFESEIKDLKGKFEENIKITDKLDDRIYKMEQQIESLKKDISATSQKNSLNDTSIDSKIYLHYYVLMHLIEYNNNNYDTALKNCMAALKTLNLLKETIFYSFDIECHIRRFSAKEIREKIKLSKNVRDEYLRIMDSYNGSSREDFIEIINMMHSKNP
jgi:uncharacterized protein YdcH (DUF465 family)